MRIVLSIILVIATLGVFCVVLSGESDFSVFVAYFALLISFGTFWYSYLTPFNLRVMPATRMLFTKGTANYGSVEFDFPLILMGFVFINRGAEGGVVRNLNLELVSKKNKYSFYPINEIRKIKLFEKEEIKEVEGNIIDRSGSFYMPGKSKLKIIFAFGQTTETTLYRGTADSNNILKIIPSGKYNCKISVLTNEEIRWKNKSEFTFTLNDEFNVSTGRREVFIDQIVDELLDRDKIFRGG